MGGGGGSEDAGDGPVPASALAAVRDTQRCVDELRDNLLQFLSMAEPDVLAEMPPLHRARVFLVLARTASELLSVRLRCSGIRPDDHPIKTEHERLILHEEKLEKFSNWSRAPLRPSTRINYKAAARFIEHSLPDLTPEQKQDMRKIREGVRTRLSEDCGSHKKRKQHQSTDKPSVRAAAQEFLEKAARELMGSSDGGVKGPYPLRDENSDGEDEPMS